MSIPMKAVREVAQLLQESGLHEVVVESSENASQAFRLKMRREPVRPSKAGRAARPAAAAPGGGAEMEKAGGEAQAQPSLLDVTATAVGVYRGVTPALQVGAAVKRKQVVAVVESLKYPNEIHAPADGTVAEIVTLPDAGVEYGQVLLRIQPA